MPDSTRRLALRVAVKFAVLGALLLFAYVLLGSLRCSPWPEHAHPPQRQQVKVTAANPLERIRWSGGSVLVLYRDEGLLNELSKPHTMRLDPTIHQAEQPVDLPALRAYDPARLVLFDRAGEMNCPLEWLPPGSRKPPIQPWPGGFREICRNGWYDAAGRPFVPAGGRAIAVPDYHWEEGHLLILGSGGDNRPPKY